ncbi:MAG: hypothetical protein ABI772_05830 [Bacteroidota bacterium]
MDNYTPRPVLIYSETIEITYFLVGFITFPSEVPNIVGGATLYPPVNNELPVLLYSENTSEESEFRVKQITPFIFKQGVPREFDVQFEDSSNNRYAKIKTSANQGHPDPVLPMLYLPRPFILEDSVPQPEETEPAVTYCFLMDTYKDDVILANGVNLSIDSTGNDKNVIITQIYQFPMNSIIDTASFDLNAQGYNEDVLFNYEDAKVYIPEND